MKSMPAHTPGPWKVHPYLASGPHCVYRDVGPGLRAVCTVIGDFEKKEMGDEKEANARLIAAAPEMLAALLGSLPAMRSVCEPNNPALIAVEAAIEKATGAA